MARKARAKANGEAPAEKAAAAATPPKNIDALTPDQATALKFHHVDKIRAAVVAKDKAVSELRRIRKVAKADLGDEGLKEVDTAIRMQTPEGEAELRAEFERTRRVAAWMGADIGTQLGLLADLPARDFLAEGKRAGLKGLIHKWPDGISQEAQQLWSRGWEEGQAVLLQGFGGKVGDTAEVPTEAADPGILRTVMEAGEPDLRGDAQKRREAEMATGEPAPLGDQPSTATVAQ